MAEKKKLMIGAYLEPDLMERVERECSIDFARPKSQMMAILMTEALDARDAARRLWWLEMLADESDRA